MYKIRKRIFEIIQIGNRQDTPSILFDILVVSAIVLNLIVTILQTFDVAAEYMPVLNVLEFVTCLFFLIEYVLRLITADFLYPRKKPEKAVLKFVFSFFGIIDLITFLPYFLPFLFPVGGAVAFRVFRVIRILRLFRINAQYDAFNVIISVLEEKKNQLFSSICMILILMLASSLTMYSLEHEAQPELFSNAFSGIWWSVSTMLTIGYGDIYPVTVLGKIMSIVISFLGVGMVAIPTGIISAGFVEQYTRLKSMATLAEETELKFVTSHLPAGHEWCGKRIDKVVFPPQLMPMMVIRKNKMLHPADDFILGQNDNIIFGTLNDDEEREIRLREIKIKSENPWIGKRLDELDISRLETVVLIRRKNKLVTPKPETEIKTGDMILVYSRFK